jgi:hypothetical protein
MEVIFESYVIQEGMIWMGKKKVEVKDNGSKLLAKNHETNINGTGRL